MSPCLICSIVEGRIPAHRIYEDDDCLAFLDIHPGATGHTLLVPKAHVSRVEDLSSEQARALFSALHRILAPIRDAVGADATTIGVNNGPGSGQEIPHVHIHIIPRRRGDRGGIIQSLGPGGRADLAETAEKIRAKMTAD
ncbi:TPA: HIT family protein [Candidatus Bathyarchaeota archaeon]|nr:HIT family protein [Candidatus Bathyarchaeota archaeon]